MNRNPILPFFSPSSFPPVPLLNQKKKKKGVPVSETVTLVGGTADGGMVCNEGLSLEH